MKIQEILNPNSLTESHKKTPSKRVQQATRGLHLYSDGERVSSDYTHYRLMMALAMSNGRDPISMDDKSWFGKRKTAHPYTQEEVDMLKQSYQAVGANYEDLNDGDLNSQEHPAVNKSSPIAKTKKNKYGV